MQERPNNPRGVDFLEFWIDDNVPARQGTWVEAGKLAKQLRRDAAAAGFTVEDLGLQEREVEKYVLDALAPLAEPGTPGD